MAESAAGAALIADPAERGALDIAEKVVERVAALAAAQVEGVVELGSALERAVGRHFPRSEAQIAGQRVRVSVQIAVAWPAGLPQVCAAVRQRVHDQVGALVGLQVDAVDVTAAKVIHVQPQQIRRVQ